MIQDPSATNPVARPRFRECDTESPVAAEAFCEHSPGERHSVFGWSRLADRCALTLILALTVALMVLVARDKQNRVLVSVGEHTAGSNLSAVADISCKEDVQTGAR
jgi:hypothetical protein